MKKALIITFVCFLLSWDSTNETETLAFGETGKNGNGVYDFTDEVEAYNRGSAYGDRRKASYADYPNLVNVPLSLDRNNARVQMRNQNLSSWVDNSGSIRYFYRYWFEDLIPYIHE